MKKFFHDFKLFISRGSIIDMAVGVVVGGAFGKIVTSLVNDIIMPCISALTGGTSVSDWKWVITEAVYNDKGAITKAESALHYGNFIQTIIDFLIIAFFIFLALRLIMNASKTLEEKKLLLDAKFSKEEHAKLLSEGKSKKEIKALEYERAHPAKVTPIKKETTDEILLSIRELLKKSNPKSDKKEEK